MNCHKAFRPFWILLLSSVGMVHGALTTYTWNGSANTDWMNAANWGATGIAPTGTVSESRLQVANTTGNELIYSTAFGTTVFAGTNTNPRSVVIGLGSGVSGQLRVTGGILEARGYDTGSGCADLIGGNGGVGRLIVDGGTYLRTNDTPASQDSGAEMVIGYGTTAGTLGELIVSNGLASIRHIRLNTGNGASVSGVIRLVGGMFETYMIRSGGTAGTRAVYFNGGTMRAGFANQTEWITSTINTWVQDGGAILDTAGYTYGLTANLTPDGASVGGLTKNGNGWLKLSGTNTYNGATAVNGGVLQFTRPISLPGFSTAGKLSVADGATLDLNVSGDTQWTTADVDGLLANNGSGFAAGSTLALDTTDGDGTNGSNIAVAALNLRKTGGNTLVLTGSNSYTGLTTVSGGALRIENGAALGTTAGGTVVSNGTRLELNGGIAVNGEPLTIIGNGGGDALGALRSVGGTNEWAGPVTLGANQARIAAVTGDLVVSGPIGDDGNNYDLLIRGPDGNLTNVVTLSGASTYGGRTVIYQNYVKLDGGDNRLPVGTVVALGVDASGHRTVGQLDLNGWDQEVAGIELNASVTDPAHVASQVITNSAGTVSRLTVNNPGDYTFRGVLGGNLELVKSGAGTLTLSGTNTYSGSTTVSGGVLRVNGSHAGGGTLSILSGGTLGGTGTVGAVAVGAGGRVAPGNSAGTLTVGGALVLDNASILDFELDAPDPVGGTGGDFIAGIGDLTLDGVLNVTSLGFDFSTALAGDKWKLLSFSGSLADQTLALGTTPSLGAGLSYAVETTTDSVYLAVIPEPATAGLLAAAVLFWGLRRRRA